MYGGGGTIFASENPIFQSKNRFLAVFAPGNPPGFQQKLERVVVAGELASPSTSLSKYYFNKLTRRRSPPAAPCQTVEKAPESSRGPQPFRTFNRAQRRVRWARGDFCAGKSHFPEQKSFPCSFCARKSERFQQKLEGVVVAGELASPSTSLSKPFLTS